MPVFISHAFENRPEFENVADALNQRGVAFWNPGEIRPGASLREQLRAAVEQCSSCIFVATRKSVESSWCGAELGAFWGAGKPIIVYLAEASLTDDELPQIVQGDVWERRIAKIADSAKEIASESNVRDAAQGRPSSIAQLSVEQLEKNDHWRGVFSRCESERRKCAIEARRNWLGGSARCGKGSRRVSSL